MALPFPRVDSLRSNLVPAVETVNHRASDYFKRRAQTPFILGNGQATGGGVRHSQGGSGIDRHEAASCPSGIIEGPQRRA
jgi:hypothetical protein